MCQAGERFNKVGAGAEVISGNKERGSAESGAVTSNPTSAIRDVTPPKLCQICGKHFERRRGVTLKRLKTNKDRK